MDNKLTKNQNIVFLAVNSFFQRRGCLPTLKEIKDILKTKGLKLKSINSVVQYLKTLEQKGYIERFSKARGIKILKESTDNFVEIPLLGNANCGEALSFADDRIEDFISISKRHIKDNQNDYFFVKAIGDSMNKKSGIKNGDLVLAKKIEEEPELNSNVVVVINGMGVIKKFQKINDEPVLLPDSTNTKHQPIILHSDDQIHICGKVEKVFGFSAMENSRNS
ncbi:hypothetical protein KJ854_04760 [Patescibacteria group bacterium]|nr:hypothetical protein [Patescibacteria group bacterium]MBU4142316.1 hypothetical protein [Patescibacteria group bacterium]